MIYRVSSMSSPQQQHVDADDEGGDSLCRQVPLCLHEWSAPHLRVGSPAIPTVGKRCKNSSFFSAENLFRYNNQTSRKSNFIGCCS